MWPEEHRTRHRARLKEMVSRCADEEMARWPARAGPPRDTGGDAHSGGCAGDRMASAGRRPVAGPAMRLAALAHRVCLVPALT